MIRCEYQEQQLISELNKYFQFDHNIYLLEKSVDTNHFIDTRGQKEFTPTSLFFFENINGNITGMESLRNVKTKKTFLIVSPVSSKFQSNFNLLNHVKTIQQLQIKMRIGLSFREVASSLDLQKLFEWSWSSRIINIFAATYSPTADNQSRSSGDVLNIFTYNPFGKFNVINVTVNDSFDNFFLKQNCNFQQHPIRVIRRRTDYFWPIALHVMNATYTELKYNATTMSEVMENQFDMALGITISVYPPNAMTIVKTFKLVIVVPEALPYGEFVAYLESIAKDTILIYSLVVIIGVMLMLSIVRYTAQKRILFFESAADVLNLLMNDNASIKYPQLSRPELFFIVPLTFVGLIIVNGILSNLQSYLTQPVLQPQIHTIEDIYKSPFPIVAMSEGEKNTATNALTILSKHKNWEDKIQVDPNVRLNAETFNRSLTFLTLSDDATMLLRIQKKLGIRGYHITEAHLNDYFDSYHVHKAFPFIERLNEIIRRLQSAGLYDEWKRRQDEFDEKKFIEEKFGSIQRRNGNEIKSFPVPIFIAYGWIGGVILLVIEIIWKISMFCG